MLCDGILYPTQFGKYPFKDNTEIHLHQQFEISTYTARLVFTVPVAYLILDAVILTIMSTEILH